MTDLTKGVLAIVATSTIWGLSPLYYKLLAHLPPLDILAHRTIWSLVLFAGVLAFQGRLGQIRAVLGTRRSAGIVAVAALMISVNWLLFIWAVQVGRTTETSLGYFIYPLVAVVMGRVLFAERLARAQWLAVTLAAVAVAVLTLGQGAAPWVSLALALSFAMYGLIKKQLPAGPVVSVTAEVLLLAPFALVALAVVGAVPGWRDLGLLMLSGPLTATPLILFSYAARRVTMSTVGLVQYLNPSLQFLCAVAIFAEPFGIWQAIAFPVIWAALALYSLSAWRREAAARRRSASSSIEAALEKKPRIEASAKP